MLLFDVNIYVFAHRHDLPQHGAARGFVEKCVAGTEPIGYSPQSLSGFIRIVTNRRTFANPTPIGTAMEFCDSFVNQSRFIRVVPGESHWSIFKRLLVAANCKANLVPDAWFAALAIEHGCTWVTADHDYNRFPDLRLENPLDGG